MWPKTTIDSSPILLEADLKKNYLGGGGVSNSPLPGGDDKILEESFAWQHEQNCLDSFFLT